VYRAFCEPRIDNVVAIDPTYGMYSVCAGVNDVEYRNVLLDENYQFKAEDLLNAADSQTKVIWLCSPNNPSGNCLLGSEVEKVLNNFEGLVVLDEAYIDFASEEGFAKHLNKYPNLIILQTFSKAWGSAAIRLGMAFASAEIIGLFNKIKYPYNVNELTQRQAIQTLKNKDEISQLVTSILSERTLLMKAFSELPWCEQVFPTDANFFLAKVTDAQSIYNYLVESGIIVRNRSSISLCKNCLRITIGTSHENEALITALKKYNA
ncbi:MAG: histidinol-phosphate transaminase, partial [Bacteroidaceae bacterium]|nr:histidinol-phosphate transaminase [Bacteroidaceae bacterium]